MIRMIVLGLANAAAATFIPAISVHSTDQEANPSTRAFLKKSDEMHWTYRPSIVEVTVQAHLRLAELGNDSV